MVYCPECGTEIKEENAKHCHECGSKIGIGNEVSTTRSSPKKDARVDSIWLFVAVLLPFIGIVGGLYFAWKGKGGAWAVVGLSIFAWLIWWLLLMSFGTY